MGNLSSHIPEENFRAISIGRTNQQSNFPLVMAAIIEALQKGTKVSSAEVINQPSVVVARGFRLNDTSNVEDCIFASAQKSHVEQAKLCEQAAKNGAALVITSDRDIADSIVKTHPKCGVVLCQNVTDQSRDAVVRGLRPLAEAVRGAISLPVLSVSGTAGKTTTRDLATSILKTKLNINSTQKNDNNIWGTTLSVLALNSQHDCAFYEYGSDGLGQTTILAKLTQPNVTYTSSIGIAHLDSIGGLDEMLACETEQYDWMVEHSSIPPVFLANMDDPILAKYFSENYQKFSDAGTVHTISSQPGQHCDYQLNSAVEFAKNDKFYTAISVQTPYGEVNAEVPLIGKHNHANICGAIALAMSSGLCSIADVVAGLENPTFTGYRSDFFREPIGNALILNDSFNSNPTGLEASMRMALRAKELMGDQIQKIVLALGDMGALGEEAPPHHRHMGQMASEFGIDMLYCHGYMTEQYRLGFGAESQAFESREALYDALIENLLKAEDSANTLILVKGGSKSKTSQIADWLRSGERS